MLKTIPACASREQIAAILDEDGCVVIENLVDDRIVDRIAGELGAVLDRANYGQGLFVGYRTKRLGSILKKSGVSFHMMTAKPVLDAMGHLLLPYCERFQLNLSQAVLLSLYIVRDKFPPKEMPEQVKGAQKPSVQPFYFPDDLIKEWISAMGFDVSARRASAYLTLRRLFLQNRPTEHELHVLESILQQNIRQLKESQTEN